MAIIDAFEEVCGELHRHTSLLAYADPEAYWELGEQLFNRSVMLIELAGAIAGEKPDVTPDAL